MVNFSVMVEEFLASLRRVRRHPRMPPVLVVVLAAALGSIVGVTDVARDVLYALARGQ